MLRTVNPVGSRQKLILAAVVRHAEQQFAARVRRRGYILQKRQRLRVKTRSRYDVSGERRVGRWIRQGPRFAARRGLQSAEVASQRRCRRNKNGARRRGGSHPSTLVSTEHKQLVLHDWPTGRRAELVPLQVVAPGCKKRTRIGRASPQKLE